MAAPLVGQADQPAQPPAAKGRAEGNALPAPPTATMRSVFREIRTLVPLSLDELRWSDPASHATILKSLERLEDAASALERHARAREAGFDELALSLGRDLREARNHYAAGQHSEARFFLTGSLQNCVSCHVRLPSDGDTASALELTERPEIGALDARERAWLLVMTRRFEEALGIWEGLMADPTISPGELDASGVLVDYLNVVLRVRTDVPRARKAMTELARRSDLPVYLEQRVKTWRTQLAALDAVRLAHDQPPNLAFGAQLAREAGQLAQGPYGRDGLIQDLAAASQLVRFLERERARHTRVTRNLTAAERTDRARAYYWLGIVEARSLDGFWINLSERHFEAAIRSDPKGPYAKRAFAQLEETQVLGYGGASGDTLPSDVWTHLEELRVLMGIE